MTGQTISHYKILEKLGEGGMGVVYKATDTKLGRTVALKFLASDRLENEEHKARFRREARAAAALDHPNICTVYEIDEAQGQTFLAMPYLEGLTVRQKVKQRPLKLDEALDIAIQAGEGLRAAHAKGIVHRDIKSANLMVSPQGQVKVMDFGLAQAADQSLLTKTETLLGTPVYMSPEQAQRLPTDRRTDIWSLGIVIYEMLIGRTPFEGEREQAVLYGIVQEEPEPITSQRARVPLDLDWVVSKALAKDAGERYQHIEEMLVDLRAVARQVAEESDTGRPSKRPTTKVRREAPARARRRRLTWALGIAASAVVLAMAGLGIRNFLPTAEAPLEPMRAVPLTSYPGIEGAGSFSPDGDRIAFWWNGEAPDDSDIYIKLIGPGPPLRLTTDPAWDHSAAWSPDGRHIAFLRGQPEGMKKMGLYLVPALGGTERKLAETRGPATILQGTCLTWSPDGRWLAVCDWADDSPGPLSVFLLAVDSGERRRLTRPPENSTAGDASPAFSPDGRTLAFARYGSGLASDLYLLDLDEDLTPKGEPRRRTFTEATTTSPVFTPDSRDIVFSSGPFAKPSLWRVPVSGSGSPERLPIGERGYFPRISRQGNLAYTTGEVDLDIYRVDLPMTDGATGAAVKLISSSRVDSGPRYSPDGDSIAFQSARSGSYEIWKCDRDGSNPVQLTSLGAPVTGRPHWAPDGKSIAFTSDVEGEFDVYVVNADGGAARRLTSNPWVDASPTWSRNGKWIYFNSRPTGNLQCFKMPAGGGPAQVVGSAGFWCRESPDGSLFYFSRDWANPSLWRVPVEGGEEEQVLESSVGGIYEVVEEGVYFVPPATPEAGFSVAFLRFATGAVERVISLEGQLLGMSLSVSPDRRSILYSQLEDWQSDIMLVENFR